MNFQGVQAEIIENKCENILVSAAAGSGKTTVMTERIVERILSRQTSVDRILVVTFTNAAAANMSAKLEAKLRERMAQTTDPEERKYLSGQIAALPSAYICTIDAFCVKVINSFSVSARNDKGELLIEPQSTVLEDNHGNALLREAFDEVFSEAYLLASRTREEDSFGAEKMEMSKDGVWPGILLDEDVTKKEWAEQFLSMVQSFGSGRDDDDLKEDMTTKLKYLRSLPNYRKWMTDNLARKAEEAQDPVSTPIYQRILSQLRRLLSEMLPDVARSLDVVDDVIFVRKPKENEERRKAMKAWLMYVLKVGTDILSNESITWDEIVSLCAKKPPVECPKPKRGKGTDPSLEDFLLTIDSFQKLTYIFAGVTLKKAPVEDICLFFRYFFGKTEKEIQEEAQAVLPTLLRYFEVVLAADERFAQKKRKEAALDFADQEQMALALLSLPDASSYYRDLFDEIYIDEYQDNSGVQDAIIQCFSKSNVFYVGDVKQSIYRFRHAKPKMFLDRAKEYQGEVNGTLKHLKKNYRSAKGILDVVNDVCYAIMREEFADIEYDENHALNKGEKEKEAPETSGSTVTLIVAENDWVDETQKKETDSKEKTETAENAAPVAKEGTNSFSDFEEDESDSDDDEAQEEALEAQLVEKEALIIAKKISELMQLPGFSYKDCAILTATNDMAAHVADMLGNCGIPARGPMQSNILMHQDLRIIVDLARITDNLLIDIPLADVMKSDIRQAGFTDGELLKIRLFADKREKKGLLFCEKVLFLAEYKEDDLTEEEKILQKKLMDFLSFINDLRTYAMQMPMSKWLEHVYSVTGYPAWVKTQKNGDERYYALMALAEWAARFDKTKRSGLRAFVGYVEELDAQKNSTTDIELSASLENVVRVMTFHKSKGLEFPYVFLCGLQKKVKTDKTSVRLNEQGEMGAIRYNPEWQAKYEPHDFFMLNKEETRELLAETIRLLYVAMTRAERKLFIVSVVRRTKDGVISGCNWAADLWGLAGTEIPYTMMWKLKSMFQLLMAALSRRYPSVEQALLSGEPFSEGDLDLTKPVRDAGSPDLAVILDKATKLSARPLETTSSDHEAYAEAGATEPGKALSEEEEERFSLLSKGVEEWAPLELVPSKTTVSDAKRIQAREEKELDEDEETTVEAINMRLHESKEKWDAAGYSASELGTLLHSAWQYLDFPGLLAAGGEVDWEAQLNQLCAYGMITNDQIKPLLPFAPCMQKFLESDLCRSIAMAENTPDHGPFREIPFALADPVKKESGKTGADGSSDEKGRTPDTASWEYSLVQGMIDCWFIDTDDQAVLIDYKSDWIKGSLEEKKAEITRRHEFQINMYAKAITAATGKPVKRKVIWMIRDGMAFDI